jgi:hypothetical protein
MIENTTL